MSDLFAIGRPDADLMQFLSIGLSAEAHGTLADHHVRILVGEHEVVRLTGAQLVHRPDGYVDMAATVAAWLAGRVSP